jgi:chromate transporter
MSRPTQPSRLLEVAAFFLRLGATAFGGPAAHLSIMQHELVEKRAWLTRQRFLDLVGACNLLPGPSSSQVAMAIGFHRAGLAGLAIAGLCFLLPSFAATMALAWAYLRYGALPQSAGLLLGVKPVIIAVILQALWNLRQAAFPAATSWPRRLAMPLLGIACLAASFLGVPPIAILLAAGVITLIAACPRKPSLPAAAWLPANLATATIPAIGLASIAFVFLKLGVVVFGSGYVLLVFLKTDLVDRLHWISNAQLLDAVTAGQITPGPVFTTATFIGYLLHGFSGATVATASVFLPSFFMVAGVGWLAPRIRQSPLASGFLNGVNVAALALMAATVIELGRTALTGPVTWALALVSAALLLRYRINATWLIAAGAAIGLLVHGLSN